MGSELTEDMRNTINGCMTGAAGLGVTIGTVPHADIPALVVLWSGMIIGLAGQADVKVDKQLSLRIAGALVKTGGIMFAGVKTVNAILIWTGVGSLLGVAANAGLNAYATKLVGKSVANTFMKEQYSESDLGAAVMYEFFHAVPGILGGNADPDTVERAIQEFFPGFELKR